MTEQKPNRLLNSKAYQKARSLVQKTIQSPERLLQLVTSAQSKSERHRSGKLSAVFDSVSASFRLMKAYAKGEYRSISIESFALLVASIIYFVMPIDVMPDFIIALGLADDAALLAWTFRAISDDLANFIEWEKQSIEEQAK